MDSTSIERASRVCGAIRRTRQGRERISAGSRVLPLLNRERTYAAEGNRLDHRGAGAGGGPGRRGHTRDSSGRRLVRTVRPVRIRSGGRENQGPDGSEAERRLAERPYGQPGDAQALEDSEKRFSSLKMKRLGVAVLIVGEPREPRRTSVPGRLWNWFAPRSRRRRSTNPAARSTSAGGDGDHSTWEGTPRD